jgi:hypothetical protein
MKKATLIMIIFCMLLLLNVPNVFAQNEANSREIDKIETTENSKTIYYTDGTKHMFVTAAAAINLEAQGYSHSVIVPTPPPTLPLKEILEIVKKIIENIFGQIGIGCSILAWAIWNRLKSLRHNRPKDYDEIERIF